MDLLLYPSSIEAWLLVLARLLGWSWMDPVISRLPWFLRMFLAGALGLIWIADMPSAVHHPLTWPGLLMLSGEFLFGAALGLVVRLIFAVAEVALQTIGLTASFGLTQVIPEQQSGLELPLRQLAFWLALLAFFSANGHGLMIKALSSSFSILPLASLPAQGAALQLAEVGGLVLMAGLQLALPMLVLVLLGHLAFSVLSRMLPAVEVFSAGLTLGAAVVLGGLALTLPLLIAGMSRVLERLPGLLALLIP